MGAGRLSLQREVDSEVFPQKVNHIASKIILENRLNLKQSIGALRLLMNPTQEAFPPAWPQVTAWTAEYQMRGLNVVERPGCMKMPVFKSQTHSGQWERHPGLSSMEGMAKMEPRFLLFSPT